MIGGVFTASLGIFSVVVFPWVSNWMSTRADTKTQSEIQEKVTALVQAHSVNYDRLSLANNDDTGALSHSERIEWLVIRIKRLQEREVLEVRHSVGLEAMLRMPNPRSDQAKQAAKSVRLKFDELIKDKETPVDAASKALEFVFGNE